MMWRAHGPGASGVRRSHATRPSPTSIEDIYVQFDAIVGETLARAGPDTLVVAMSDHGFTSWRRSFHLNSWLRDQGYLVLVDPKRRDDPGFFANVDWSRTQGLRARAERPVHQPQGTREATAPSSPPTGSA